LPLVVPEPKPHQAFKRCCRRASILFTDERTRPFLPHEALVWCRPPSRTGTGRTARYGLWMRGLSLSITWNSRCMYSTSTWRQTVSAPSLGDSTAAIDFLIRHVCVIANPFSRDQPRFPSPCPPTHVGTTPYLAADSVMIVRPHAVPLRSPGAVFKRPQNPP